jgi:NAD(P)H-dependent FMN reductase
MFYVPVILGSVRRGRKSPIAARFVVERLRRSGKFEPELLDLAEYNLPIMEERLRFRDDPPPVVVEMGAKLARADAIVVVSPEYNNGYPGVLKNALDYFLPEYKRKPVGIVTVSGGGFGGINALAQLRLVFLAMGAYPISIKLPVSRVQDAFDENDNPKDPLLEKAAAAFTAELLWLTEAIAMKKLAEA